ncbi:MAG: hypothetical protein AAGK79_19130 [Pseudomonadota bacterium]
MTDGINTTVSPARNAIAWTTKEESNGPILMASSKALSGNARSFWSLSCGRYH